MLIVASLYGLIYANTAFQIVTSCTQEGTFSKKAIFGHYSSGLGLVLSKSKTQCASSCLQQPDCTAISVRKLTGDNGNGISCIMSDGLGDFHADNDWRTYTIYQEMDPCNIEEPTTTTEPTPPPVPLTCPPDYEVLDGGCYQYRIGTKTWDQAQQDCALEAGHLVTISSIFEQNQISIRIQGIRGIGKKFLAGGQNVGGGWQWVSSEPFSFTYWESGYPGSTTPKCLLMETYPGMWTTTDCSTSTYEYMCEIDVGT